MPAFRHAAASLLVLLGIAACSHPVQIERPAKAVCTADPTPECLLEQVVYWSEGSWWPEHRELFPAVASVPMSQAFRDRLERNLRAGLGRHSLHHEWLRVLWAAGGIEAAQQIAREAAARPGRNPYAPRDAGGALVLAGQPGEGYAVIDRLADPQDRVRLAPDLLSPRDYALGNDELAAHAEALIRWASAYRQSPNFAPTNTAFNGAILHLRRIGYGKAAIPLIADLPELACLRRLVAAHVLLVAGDIDGAADEADAEAGCRISVYNDLLFFRGYKVELQNRAGSAVADDARQSYEEAVRSREMSRGLMRKIRRLHWYQPETAVDLTERIWALIAAEPDPVRRLAMAGAAGAESSLPRMPAAIVDTAREAIRSARPRALKLPDRVYCDLVAAYGSLGMTEEVEALRTDNEICGVRSDGGAWIALQALAVAGYGDEAVAILERRRREWGWTSDWARSVYSACNLVIGVIWQRGPGAEVAVALSDRYPACGGDAKMFSEALHKLHYVVRARSAQQLPGFIDSLPQNLRALAAAEAAAALGERLDPDTQAVMLDSAEAMLPPGCKGGVVAARMLNQTLRLERTKQTERLRSRALAEFRTGECSLDRYGYIGLALALHASGRH